MNLKDNWLFILGIILVAIGINLGLVYAGAKIVKWAWQ
jgi:hypothetical protein